MTFERLSETPAKKGAPPIPQKRSKSFELCMNSKRRTISHRTSSNRHRKLQPFSKARTTNRKEGEKETAEGTTKTKQKQEQN
ncbi:uncharacterized protein Dmoj_GI25665, isoform A [Drosophila mojavensis]|uniref:Uncharacterized protein, isoform A n=1 Tax=Drosophila mojavensis TaxID=7230 RepID=A0A0Q9XQT9_DROMO|nr:uncharacterized protein Dmoj_GI25665, isoform A [Drosophila mojavensis]